MSKAPPPSAGSSSSAGASSSKAGPSSQPRRHSPGPVYELRPPGWRPPLSSEADLGFPDFFPNRPGHGQDEDTMSEGFIRGGYVSKWGLSNSSETFSIHGMVLQSLGKSQLGTLNDSMSSLLSKRQDESSAVDPHTYKIPPRLVLHETKKQAYVADLANPAVPLHRLSRSIPHGFKGNDLLEMLANNDVALDRALWFIKVSGGSELLSLRSAKSQSLAPQAQQSAATQASATYTTDFTNAFANFLKTQLAQVTVPSTLPAVLRTSTTFSVKTSFKSVFSVPANRDRWLKKWAYSSRLLQACQLPEHALIDRRALLGWVVGSVATANVAQLGFVAKLLEDYSHSLHVDGSLSRTFLESALGRLAGDLAGKKELERTVARLSKVIQCLFLAAPHLFVSPRLFSQHLAQLDLLLSTATAGQGMLPPFIARDDPVAHEILAAMGDAWEAVKARNDALMFRSWGIGGGKGVWSERKGTLGDIWILDSITALSDMARVAKAFFGSLSQPSSAASAASSPAEAASTSTLGGAFAVKLDILLSWATAKAGSRSRTATAQRSYAVSTILSLFLAARAGTSHQPAEGWPAVVQDEVFRWLEDSALARADDNVEVVAEVVGEMARRGVVSYAAYLMRLIARGITWSAIGRDWEEGQDVPHHLRLLRSIPLFSSSQSIRHQRHVVLYGSDPEAQFPQGWDTEALLNSSRGELIAAFPEILLGDHFEDESFSRSMAALEVAPLETTLPTLLRAPRYVQVEAVSTVLLSAILSADSPFLKSALLVRVIELLERLSNYSAVLDIVILILESAPDDGVLDSTIDCIKRCTQIWTTMDVKARLVEALLERYLLSRSTATPHRALLELLLQAADAGLLHEELKSALLQDQAVFEMDQTGLPLVFGNVAPPPGPTEEMLAPPSRRQSESAEGSMGKALWGRYVDASDLLQYLTRAGYEKHILSDEAELVSEALKGLEGRPSEKFIITATRRLTAILQQASISPTSTCSQLDAFVEEVNGVLQIVAFALAQSKPADAQSAPPAVACDAGYAPSLLAVMEAIRVLCEGSTSSGPARPGQALPSSVRWTLVVALRLLHVLTGLARYNIAQVWTAETKGMIDGFLTSLLRLAVIHAGTVTLDKELFELLMDSLWAFLEDLPKDVKLSAATTLRIFQATSSPQHLAAIPDDLKAQLAALLPVQAQPSFGADLLLVTSTPRSAGDAPPAVERLPVRPWEWNEQIEAPAAPVSHRETFLPVQPVRNTASVSLGLFQAEGTRERLPERSTSAWFPPLPDAVAPTHADDDGSNSSTWAAIRSEQTYTDELEGSAFAHDHLHGMTEVRLPDELLQAKRPSLSGSSALAPPAPTANDHQPPSSQQQQQGSGATKPSKGAKRKASASSASGPPAQRLKGSSAADAVVLDGADQVEPAPSKGKKGGKAPPAKAAAGQPSKAGGSKAGGSKKRKNSTA